MEFSSPQAWAFWLVPAIAAYLGAYMAEKAKRRAAREDRDQILEEVAKTTQRLKQIEATISNEIWERQWRLNQKRETYVSLMDLSQQLIDHHTHLLGYSKTAESNPVSARECDVSSAKLVDLNIKWGRVAVTAFLFLDQKALQILPRFSVVTKEGDPEQDYSKAIENLHLAQSDLIQCARADLGVA